MKLLTGKIARFIFALPFAIFGVFHFMNASEMEGMLDKWPVAEMFIYLSGAGLIAAALAIVINKNVKIASLLLALLLFIIFLAVHLPGLSDPETMQVAMNNSLKDIGLLGGALILAGTAKN